MLVKILERYIVREVAEKRDAVSNQHWNTRDNHALNEPGSEKALNRDPAIHIYMPNASSL